jgi:hypothetical protein
MERRQNQRPGGHQWYEQIWQLTRIHPSIQARKPHCALRICHLTFTYFYIKTELSISRETM